MTSIPTSSQLSEVTNSSNGNDILAPFPPDSLPLDQLDINEGIMMSLVNQIMKKNSALVSLARLPSRALRSLTRISLS